jgi:hypothetical protein
MRILGKNPLLKPFFLRPLVALFIAVLYFLFHLHFMPRFIDWDSSAYLNNIWKALRSIDYLLFNPHHLHVEVSGVLFQQWMLGAFGRYGFTDLLFNMEIRSLLFACVGVFFAVLYFWNITGKAAWAVLGSLLIGFTHVYLNYATKVDTAIFPASLFIGVAWLIRRMETIRGRRVLLLAASGGGILFLGVMAHQYMAIACGLACLCSALPPWLFPQEPLRPFSIARTPKKGERASLDAKPSLRYSRSSGAPS